MIGDAKDVLYLVLAFCVLWFTIFVCWLLYYFISIMREMRGTVRDFRGRLAQIGSALDEIKEKFASSLSIFSGLADGVKYVVGYLMDRRGERRSTGSRRKKHEKTEEEEEQV